METVFTFDNPAFQYYAFYSAILIMKVLLMAPLTSRHRLAKKKYISQEDVPFLGKPKDGSRVGNDDPDIERVRRAHLNDLENIPAFLFIAALYLLTNPAEILAINLIRFYAIARILHTLVYAVWVIPQPARAFSWAAGYGITFYMAFSVVRHCL